VNEQSRNQLPSQTGAAAWIFFGVVWTAGLGALVASVLTSSDDLLDVLSMRAFWAILLLILLGELRPMVTAGMTDAVGVVTSAAFVFAALIFFGLPVAALLHVLTAVVTGVVRRKAWWRTAFNAAQYTLSLTSAWLVLTAFGLGGTVSAPHPPLGREILVLGTAALAYSATNHLLVWATVSIISRRSLVEIARGDVRYQLVVDASLFSLGIITAVLLGHAPRLALLLAIPLLAVSRVGSSGAEHERLALADPLTGLANRAALKAAAAGVLQRAREADQPVAVLALDLDEFKPINDRCGHHVGDSVLRVTAARLRAVVRDEDLAARLGGDEFAVLLTEVDGAAGTRRVTDRLRVSLAQPVVVDGQVLRVGTSIGAALFPEDGEDLDALLRVADRRMYVDKASGGSARLAGSSDR
jgi:diguanylate cyclase (GGDEF)-like protein